MSNTEFFISNGAALVLIATGLIHMAINLDAADQGQTTSYVRYFIGVLLAVFGSLIFVTTIVRAA